MRPVLWSLSLCTLLSAAAPAGADVVRFRYTPQDLCGRTSLRVCPDGSTGEWRPSALSPVGEGYYCQPRATHIVTYRHPATGQNVQVPIAFPEGTPRVSNQLDAVVYSYTSYTIRVEFLPDGSVDVIYNSGFLRPLWF